MVGSLQTMMKSQTNGGENQSRPRQLPAKSSSSALALTQSEDPSSTSRSSFDVQKVSFDPELIMIQAAPEVDDKIEKENLWLQEAELKRELLDCEKLVEKYQKQADASSRWLFWNNQQRCDELCGILKSIKHLVVSKRPTEKVAVKLVACLDRAPEALRGLEHRLLPQYQAAVRQHVRSICNAQYQHNSMALADRASQSSRGSVLFGQALARHDFVQTSRPHY
uniref:Uncharacterized protein n=1 Tax=Amphora coffeiformis TaxID=265554 RepID=A0A7S3L6H8_9STRA|mmetsp:Transcript_12021/g.23083  ORF Transcript_12021/g.23083 Transcript_12021/m.23083 type:complete len:223 (+) Transcript_12021:27-695(+)